MCPVGELEITSFELEFSARKENLEAFVDDVRGDADRLEDLGALVRLQRRYAHLGHDFGDPVLHGIHVILLNQSSSIAIHINHLQFPSLNQSKSYFMMTIS